MANIINAKDLNPITREDIVEMFCNELMKDIMDANKQGRRKTCFGVVWITLKNGNHICMDDYESDVEKVFRANGYTIKPTGYIGGVWQKTKDIIW